MKNEELLEEFLNSVTPGVAKNQRIINKLNFLVAILFSFNIFNNDCIDRAICDHIKALNQMRKIKEDMLKNNSLVIDYKKYIINKSDLKRFKQIEKSIEIFSEGLDKEHVNMNCVEDLIRLLSEDENMTLQQAIEKYDNKEQ